MFNANLYKVSLSVWPAIFVSVVAVVAFSLLLSTDLILVLVILLVVVITWFISSIALSSIESKKTSDSPVADAAPEAMECIDKAIQASDNIIPPLLETLDQLQGVISDASGKLHLSFNGLTENSNRQSSLTLEVINQLRNDEDGVEEMLFDKFASETAVVLHDTATSCKRR